MKRCLYDENVYATKARIYTVFCTIFLMCLLFPIKYYAQQTATPEEINNTNTQSSVIKIFDESTVIIRYHAEYLRDPLHILTVEDIASSSNTRPFFRAVTDHPNFGYTSDNIWARVTIRNTLSTSVSRIIDVTSQIVDSVILYTPKGNNEFTQQISGNAVFIELRAMKSRRVVFEIHLAPHEQKTYYVKANGLNPLLFTMKLYPLEDFKRVERDDDTQYGIVWGVILCMIVFNTALFLATKSRLYALSVLHLGASLCALLAVVGFWGEVLWFDVPNYNTRALSVTVCWSNILSIIFAQNFCKTRQIAPRLHRLMNGLIIVASFLLCLSIVGQLSSIIAGSFTLLVIVCIVVGGYYARKDAPQLVRSALTLYIWSWIICNLGIIAANIAGSQIFPEYGELIATKLGLFSGATQILLESFSLSLYSAQAQVQLVEEQQQRLLAERERELEHERNLELAKINTSILRQQEELEERKTNTEQANIMLQEVNQELLMQQQLLQQQREVTEQVNAKLQLQYAQMENINKEKSEFLGIAAHDLKNPLTGLKGMLEILRSGDSIQPAYLNRMAITMQQSVDRMFDIVKNLLDVNAIEQGAMQPSFREEDLLMLTKAVCDSYRLAAAHKRIRIEFKANRAEVPCFSDGGFVTQIVDNLVSNALKYSPHQTSVLVRTLAILPHAGDIKFLPNILVDCNIQEWQRITEDSAVLVVKDQGPGLNDDDKSKLFQKFARLSAQPTGGEHSTGLGLSIAKRLVDSLHGQIWCESTEGQGAAFVVVLPMNKINPLNV